MHKETSIGFPPKHSWSLCIFAGPTEHNVSLLSEVFNLSRLQEEHTEASFLMSCVFSGDDNVWSTEVVCD